jgi:hypothetical protein
VGGDSNDLPPINIVAPFNVARLAIWHAITTQTRVESFLRSMAGSRVGSAAPILEGRTRNPLSKPRSEILNEMKEIAAATGPSKLSLYAGLGVTRNSADKRWERSGDRR